MSQSCAITPEVIAGGGRALVVIGGPCVLERPETNEEIARVLREACKQAGLAYVFKASFDKANRSSIASARGPGMQAGLEELRRIKSALGVPTTTDVHLPNQAAEVAEVVDLLQVPAFLCRQTDLLTACAETGRPVNVKKGQFLSPGEMKQVMGKLHDGGCRHMMFTERGTFFGYQRLVNDFIGLGDLMDLGPPVCFDATHSTQLPGAEGNRTGGRPERVGLLAKAAAAAGVDAIFLECHPDPRKAESDASTMLKLADVPALLHMLRRIHTVARGQ